MSVWIPISSDYLTAKVKDSSPIVHALATKDWRPAADDPDAYAYAVCGAPVTVLFARATGVDELGEPLGLIAGTWPPYKSRDGAARCEHCWKATGKRRPDKSWSTGDCSAHIYIPEDFGSQREAS